MDKKKIQSMESLEEDRALSGSVGAGGDNSIRSVPMIVYTNADGVAGNDKEIEFRER